MKESLGNFVDAYMRCAPLNADTGRIKRELSESAHAFRLPSGTMTKEETPPDLGKYGFELWFDGAGADTGFWVSAIPKGLSLAVKLARQSLRDRRLHNTEVSASPVSVMS
jgi:hypothetical protein